MHARSNTECLALKTRIQLLLGNVRDLKILANEVCPESVMPSMYHPLWNEMKLTSQELGSLENESEGRVTVSQKREKNAFPMEYVPINYA